MEHAEQCREFIRQQGWEAQAFASTATAAAELAKCQRRDVGVIANSTAAQGFGLDIALAGIQDYSENHTRFVVVQRGVPDLEKASKTMLLLAMEENRPGALGHVLNLFAAAGVSLSRIESRPTRKKLGTYQFFMDVDAGLQEESTQKVIEMIRMLGHKVRVLGGFA